MPGQTVAVKRKEKLGWVERIYIPMLAKGVAVTTRHFLRNMRGFITGKNRTDFVVQYPEQRVDYADAFRGVPVLVQMDDGRPRCVACGLCEYACPSDVIRIIPGELPEAGIERYPEIFEMDMARCMFCGLCEEACPEEAIVMSRCVELAAFDRASMVYNKEELLVPESRLKRRLDFLRRGYEDEYEPRRPRGAATEGAGQEETAEAGGDA